MIVNAAAHTAVDKAESEPEFAQLLNATSVEAIAKEAAKIGAGLFIIQQITFFRAMAINHGVKRMQQRL